MEEAATPLPSEETTPPVTNIYFGAIRIARAVTRFTTPDFLPLRRGYVVVPTSQPAVGLRTNNYGRAKTFCQFQLFAPPHQNYLSPRNFFTGAGFISCE
jgi:hypothetical protein